MEILFLFFLFILGTVVGSFLDVLIDRLPTGKNPFVGRSHCDFCHRTLSPVDLIPLVSFIFLKGRCRKCHKKLSWQYPLIEVSTGLLFIILFWFLSSGRLDLQENIKYQISNIKFFVEEFAALLLVFCSFLVIFVSDLKYQIIPDEMIVSAAVGAIVLGFLGSTLLYSAIGAIIAWSIFYGIYLGTHKKGMGFGDVKLAPVLGFFLGFPQIVVGLYVAFLTGALISTILLLTKKKKIKQRIAFGPFLIFGTVVSYIYGIRILDWYLGFFK